MRNLYRHNEALTARSGGNLAATALRAPSLRAFLLTLFSVIACFALCPSAALASSATGAGTASISPTCERFGVAIRSHEATTYRFEYLTEAKLEQNEAEGKEPFSGAEKTPEYGPVEGSGPFSEIGVSANACGLVPATAYVLRAVVTSAANPGGSPSDTSPSFTTLPHRPFVRDTSFAALTPACELLRATINPQDAATTYHFEYLTEVKLEQNEEEGKEPFSEATLTPPASIGEGAQPLPASTEVCGLSSTTAYRFRPVATNSQGTTTGQQGFTTLPYGPSHELAATFGTAPSDPVPLAGPSDVAVDQPSGDVYVTDPGIDERQTLAIFASAGTYTLAFGGQTTAPIPFGAGAGEVQAALEAIPTIGPNGVIVTVPPEEEDGEGIVAAVSFEVTFRGTLGAADLEQLQADGTGLQGGTATVATAVDGAPGSAVEKFTSQGEFLLIFGKEVNKTAVEAHAPEAQQNVCTAASHDKCQPGTPGPATPFCITFGNGGGITIPCEPITDIAPGQLDEPTYLAVDNTPHGEGDVYVADDVTHLVQKFSPSGQIIRSWGENGQQAGPTSPTVGETEQRFAEPYGIAVGPEGDLYVGINLFLDQGQSAYVFTQEGAFIRHPSGEQPYVHPDGNLGLKIDRVGQLYSAAGLVLSRIRVIPGSLNVTLLPGEAYAPFTANGFSTTGFALDPSPLGEAEELYQDAGPLIYRYSSDCEPRKGPCEPSDSFGSGQLSAARGIALDGATHTVYVADTGADRVAAFTDIRPAVTTEAPTEITETTLTLAGHLDPATNGEDHGPIVRCFFEWGTSRAYGHTAECSQHLPISTTGETEVSAELTDLPPITTLPVGASYHYRLVAVNQKGAVAQGHDRTARTTAPPQIEGVSASHLSATSAQLDATIIPEGLPTTYRFSYGPTTAYGQATPAAELTGTTNELFEPHRVKLTVEGLQPGATYHFRLTAENQAGTTTSEDATFEFFPPACPNSAVRQQTGSAFLPDCRAYELVSPQNAGGTLLFPGGPSSSRATSPSRFAFVGNFGSIPGQETINTGGDLYLATRTDSGWLTHYIGLSGSEAGCMGGSPNAATSYGAIENPTELQQAVLADPSLSRLLDWQLGEAISGCALGSNGTAGANSPIAPASNAPYLWSADGSLIQHLPTDLSTTTGAPHALECPHESRDPRGTCTSEVTASPDLNHLIFSSNQLAFAPGGLSQAPGSAYDDDLETGEVRLVSTLKKDGEPIPQDPAFAATPTVNSSGSAHEFLRFPAVSADGSHVLISTATSGLGSQECDKGSGPVFAGCPRPFDYPVHLYMSIDDAGAVEVSKSEVTGENVPVDYVGMTEDGSKVFFTSEEHFTGEDEEHAGASLYMWSQKGEEENPPHPLTLISKANPGSPAGAGDTASCIPAKYVDRAGDEVPWTTSCGVLPFSSYPFSGAYGGAGGDGVSDTAIASQSGDIYFYSPEQLDGTRGVAGLENLYDYRQGALHFVATLNPEVHCIFSGFDASKKELGNKVCTAGPIVRIDVSPDGSHMAFATSTQLTSYESAGHVELYSYTPSSGTLVCDSCNPSGQPATADAELSQDGLFMTDDGRVFFATEESLVPADTNRSTDVYEYVDGRPQLITPGTGTATVSTTAGLGAVDEHPGLIGVSANGTDVYFSTFDVLLPEDQNGDFLKFYDARTDGGFPQPPPVQPCAAAEECHGPGTEAPIPPTQGTAAHLAGGNATPASHKHHGRKHHKKAKKKRHGHRANAHRGGKR